MPLDHFKTQVLLLHSEQSTLDSLSAGIDDRYTVHCATSGSEALTTLGETPIHVIISAHKLPGMSGAEALREAKKRSPETIGILLADNDDRNIEAIVGEKELFQVVRGGVTAADLGKLVDNATRQMRLLALAESANDRAANPDEPAEHIVMETSENGSTIISDGTGQFPALDAKKVSASEAAGARSVDVLVITRDEEFLSTVRESTRGMHNIRHANTLAEAEAALTKNRVGVAVVDAAMVGANVEKLTQHLKRKSARLVNIVAGRRDDGEMLMDLINRGKVYRFLLKPVSPGRARLAIEASVKHHLEAPDSAFTPVGRASDRPAPKPAPKQATKPTPGKPALRAAKPAGATAKPAPPKARPKAAEPATEPPEPPLDDGLSGAFGDDKSFTETMTDIVGSIGKGFSRRSATPAPPEKPRDRPGAAAASGAPAPLSIEADTDGGSLFRNPKVLGVGAVVAAVLLAGGYWLFGDSGQPAGADRPATADERTAPVPRESELSPASAGELRERGREALEAGRIVQPAGDNAVELFAAAVAASPLDAGLKTELDAAIDEAISLAEIALLDRRVDDAELALDRIAAADPDNARLRFLGAQLAELKLRAYLDSAREAIRDERFDDAAAALSAAGALDVADRSGIAALEDELVAARSAQRVEDVIARAAERVDDGRLIEPANDNARYFYELALSTDPDNPAARQGLTVVASKLVLRAREEIDAGRLSSADTLLAEARRLDPGSAELGAAAQALESARADIAATERRQQEAAEQRAAEERRIEAERQAEAGRQAEAARQAEAERAEAERRAAEADAASQASAGAAAPAGESVADSEAGAADSEDAEMPAEPETVADAAATPAQDNSPLPISALERTKYVAPKYPRAAERRNISGWVDVVFTVASDGTTANIEILNSDPGDTFVNAALRAVERWEFEPIVEDGQVVERRAGVRLMFALE